MVGKRTALKGKKLLGGAGRSVEKGSGRSGYGEKIVCSLERKKRTTAPPGGGIRKNGGGRLFPLGRGTQKRKEKEWTADRRRKNS